MKKKEKPGNPQAFPCTGNPDWNSEEGMTLRDYFAAKAMQAYFSDTGLVWETGTFADATKTAYQLADAMLKERSKH